MSLSTQSNLKTTRRRRYRRRLFEMVLFAMLGSMMFCSKILLEVLPNIHLLGMLTVTFTVVFRAKALIPIYIYVFLNGLYAGFGVWWYPYLYIWTVLWAVTMLLPRRMPTKVAAVVYPIVCALHGFCYGLLYAPGQALLVGFSSMQQFWAWVVAGLPYDAIHGISNFFVGFLILPFSRLLQKLLSKIPD